VWVTSRNKHLSAAKDRRGHLQMYRNTSEGNPPEAQHLSRHKHNAATGCRCSTLSCSVSEAGVCIRVTYTISESLDLVLSRYCDGENGWSDNVMRLLFLGNAMVVLSDSPPRQGREHATAEGSVKFRSDTTRVVNG
jgi:hypothetical protein